MITRSEYGSVNLLATDKDAKYTSTISAGGRCLCFAVIPESACVIVATVYKKIAFFKVASDVQYHSVSVNSFILGHKEAATELLYQP